MMRSILDKFKGRRTVIFMLGGPGTGKGTQSALIQKHYGFKHLSAGELLREERKSGSAHGQLIESNIREGKIVPSHITVNLLDKAIQANPKHSKFLVDGFPRNIENLRAWLRLMTDKTTTPIVITLKCTQENMIQRLLERSKSSGRSDDNLESIRKRLVVNQTETQQTLNYFKGQGKLVEIPADQSVSEVFEHIRKSLDKVL